MRIAKHRIIASLILAITAVGYAAAPARADEPTTLPAAPTDPALQAAMAERFCDLALNGLHNKTVTKPMLQLAEALLQESMKLNPNEPRYPRLLEEAALQLKDYDTALAALKTYTHLVPHDELAILERVGLEMEKMETADAKLAYLEQLIGATQVSPTLRSRFALQAANIYADRREVSQARESLMQSIRLDPLNQDARRTWLRWVSDAGNSYDQIGQLLALLQANPAQADVLQALAEQFASAGMVPESLSFYGLAFSILQRTGGALNRELVIGYASEYYIAGDRQKAFDACVALLRSNNADADALELAILIARGSDKQDDNTKAELGKLRVQLQNVLLNHLTTSRQKAIDQTATTRPVDSDEPISLPDFVGDQKLLKDKGSEADQQAYASALGDLVWFEFYYNDDAPDGLKMLDALQQMEPDNSVAVARLRGWYLLMTHDDAQARAKFTAISDRDPLAQLGLIRLDAADATSKIHAVDTADKLLSDYPAGMLGATLVDGTGGLNAHGTALPVAKQIRADLSKFPQDWLQIVDQPQRFYVLRGEPLRLSHDFGEPMIATVTIENISNFALTIGREGVIHPDLWIDAQTRGAVQQPVPGAAVTQLAGPLVLNPRESTSVQVRIDQGVLGQLLNAQPMVAFEIFAKVKTNVTNGGQATGPCGYAADFTQLFVRSENPAGEALQKMSTTIVQGAPVAKLNVIDLGAAYFQLIAASKPDQATADFAGKIYATLGDALRDPSPEITAWTTFRMVPMFSAPVREDQLDKMMLSADSTERLIGLRGAAALGWEKWLAEAQKLANDPDPIVKEAAAAIAGIAQEQIDFARASTQPTTEAATQPESEPSTPTPNTSINGGASSPESLSPTTQALPVTQPSDTTPPAATTEPSENPTLPATLPAATLPAELAPATVPSDVGAPALPATAPATQSDLPTTVPATPVDLPATVPAATQAVEVPATAPATNP